jgi:hypothetical protein
MIFITVGGRVIVFHLHAYGSYGIHFSPVVQKSLQKVIRLLQKNALVLGHRRKTQPDGPGL